MSKQSNFVTQHPYDGDMVIDINTIQGIRLSKDEYNAEVLFNDTWIRITVEFEKAKKMASALK